MFSMPGLQLRVRAHGIFVTSNEKKHRSYTAEQNSTSVSAQDGQLRAVLLGPGCSQSTPRELRTKMVGPKVAVLCSALHQPLPCVHQAQPISQSTLFMLFNVAVYFCLF